MGIASGFKVTVCPGCKQNCYESPGSLGVCSSCHQEILAGKRCKGCFEVGHNADGCPYSIELVIKQGEIRSLRGEKIGSYVESGR